MNYYIKQTIHINSIKIGDIMNSSVFQIGSSGIIKPVTKLITSKKDDFSADNVSQKN